MLSNIVASDILIVSNYFSGKIRLDISCATSTRQMIHMKSQALFSQKNDDDNNNNNNNKTLECCLLQLL